MPKIRLVFMGEMSRLVDYRMLDMEFEGTTLGELLRGVRTHEGVSLYELMAEQGWLGSRCHLYVNERYVVTPQGFDRPLADGDRVIVSDRMRAYFAG